MLVPPLQSVNVDRTILDKIVGLPSHWLAGSVPKHSAADPLDRFLPRGPQNARAGKTARFCHLAKPVMKFQVTTHSAMPWHDLRVGADA